MENSKFFKISNEYQDAKCRIRIPGQAGQVLSVIERLTWGWRKKEAEITLRTFRKMTDMDNSHVIRSRSKLLKMGVIISALQGNKNRVRYRIQSDYTKWKPVPYRASTLQGNKSVPSRARKPVPSRETPTPVNKDILFKDINIKDSKRKKIKQLKLRKKELQDDLKKKNQFENKEYLIKGIKEIEKQLKKLGGKNGRK